MVSSIFNKRIGVLIGLVFVVSMVLTLSIINSPMETNCKEIPYEQNKVDNSIRLPPAPTSGPMYPIDVATGKEVKTYLKCEATN